MTIPKVSVLKEKIHMKNHVIFFFWLKNLFKPFRSKFKIIQNNYQNTFFPISLCHHFEIRKVIKCFLTKPILRHIELPEHSTQRLRRKCIVSKQSLQSLSLSAFFATLSNIIYTNISLLVQTAFAFLEIVAQLYECIKSCECYMQTKLLDVLDVLCNLIMRGVLSRAR